MPVARKSRTAVVAPASRDELAPVPATKARGRKAAPKSKDTSEAAEIVLQTLRKKTVEIPIEGVTELIMHKWSEKAKRMMRDAHTGKARQKRDPKDPAAECEAATHRLLSGQPGMPAVAFKAAIIQGARNFDGITMTSLKTAIFVHGEPEKDGYDLLVPIDGKWRMREDMTRNQTGVADIRYRPGYFPWRTTLRVTLLENILSPEMLVNLVEAGGTCGVGEWRPSSKFSLTGTYGCWVVSTGK